MLLLPPPHSHAIYLNQYALVITNKLSFEFFFFFKLSDDDYDECMLVIFGITGVIHVSSIMFTYF